MTSNDKQSNVLTVLTEFKGEAVGLLTDESVNVYLFLKNRLSENADKIDKHHVFQFIYRSFYRLDNAGLGDKLKYRYFELFSEYLKTNKDVDIRYVCDELGKIENLKNTKSMPFSFATKMAATINAEFPIYDSLVAKVFGFSPPHSIKNWDNKFNIYSNFYKEIKDTISWLKSQKSTESIMEGYNNKISNWSQVPEVKKYDFVFWATGKAIDRQA